MTTRHSIFDERSKNCSSNLPLRSPSPDLKHMSIITPTLLPDSVEIKQFCTTPANKTKYLSSEKLYEELYGTSSKHYAAKTQADFKDQLRLDSHIVLSRALEDDKDSSPYNRDPRKSHYLQHYSALLRYKEYIIIYLKNIIRMINYNSCKQRKKNEQSKSTNYEYDKNKIKVLTIENYKLLDIIYKMRAKKDEGIREGGRGQIDSIREEISVLRMTLAEKYAYYYREIDYLLRLQNTLKQKCKDYERYKQKLYNYIQQAYQYNEKLMRVLRDRETSAKWDSIRPPSGHKKDYEEERLNRTVSSYKTAITKIKEQYQMSLKQFKDTITMDVETIFETIRIGLTSLNAKVEEMESKVSSIEKHVRSTLQLPARTMHKERSYKEHKEKEPYKEKQKKDEMLIEYGVSSSMSETSNDKIRNTYAKMLEYLSFSIARSESERIKDSYNKTEELYYYKLHYLSRNKELYSYREYAIRRYADMLKEINVLRREIDQLYRCYKKYYQERYDNHQSDNKVYTDRLRYTMYQELQRLTNNLEYCKIIAEHRAGYVDRRKKYVTRLENELVCLYEYLSTMTELKRENKALLAYQERLIVSNNNQTAQIKQYRKLCQLMKSEAATCDYYQLTMEYLRKEVLNLQRNSQAQTAKQNIVLLEHGQLTRANEELQALLKANYTNCEYHSKLIVELKYKLSTKYNELQYSIGHIRQQTIRIYQLYQQLHEASETEQANRRTIQELYKQMVVYLGYFNKFKNIDSLQQSYKLNSIDSLDFSNLIASIDKAEQQLSNYSYRQTIVVKTIDESTRYLIDPGLSND